jgi:hypothetical protein
MMFVIHAILRYRYTYFRKKNVEHFCPMLVNDKMPHMLDNHDCLKIPSQFLVVPV